VVSHIGNLCHRKGTLEVIAAAKEENSPIDRLILLGPSGCSQVDAALASLGGSDSVNGISWRKSASREEVRRTLDTSHVLLLPSQTEGQPLVVMEAMARGRAVLATGVGGIPDMLPAGQLLDVQPGASIVERIVSMLQVWAERPEALLVVSEQNRRIADAAYTPDAYRERFGVLVRSILQECPPDS
jgi:glycosyltransferase involved in cell wall biosynthesis